MRGRACGLIACRIFSINSIAAFAYGKSGSGYFFIDFLDYLRWEGWIGFSNAWACGVERRVEVLPELSAGVQVRNRVSVWVVQRVFTFDNLDSR